jgi:hypothetical protein
MKAIEGIINDFKKEYGVDEKMPQKACLKVTVHSPEPRTSCAVTGR